MGQPRIFSGRRDSLFNYHFNLFGRDTCIEEQLRLDRRIARFGLRLKPTEDSI